MPALYEGGHDILTGPSSIRSLPLPVIAWDKQGEPTESQSNTCKEKRFQCHCCRLGSSGEISHFQMFYKTLVQCATGGDTACVSPDCNSGMLIMWEDLWQSMPQSGKTSTTVHHYAENKHPVIHIQIFDSKII